MPIIENNGLVGASLANAQSYRLFSARLIDSAKLLIEQLIDRNITDDQLRCAQQALDRGERSLDGAILSRLSSEGLDAVGRPPLFPDLDALFSAIESAEKVDFTSGDAT